VTLTGKQRRYLRGLGHNLNPIVAIGKEGLTPNLTLAIDQALEDHELIKVRIGQNALVDRHEVAEQLAVESSSETVQVLGSTILLYRAHPDKPTIRLPRPSPAATPDP
jgi:RNA-binding protein